MKITSVTFRSSVSLEKFQHAHVEATATVAPREDPQKVLDELKEFVADQLVRCKEGDVPVERPRTGRFPRL